MKNRKNKEEGKTGQASGLRHGEALHRSEALRRNEGLHCSEGLLSHGEAEWPKWPPTDSLQRSSASPR